MEIQHRERAAREENKLITNKLHEERDNSRNAVETLKRELNESKVRKRGNLTSFNTLIVL